MTGTDLRGNQAVDKAICRMNTVFLPIRRLIFDGCVSGAHVPPPCLRSVERAVVLLRRGLTLAEVCPALGSGASARGLPAEDSVVRWSGTGGDWSHDSPPCAGSRRF